MTEMVFTAALLLEMVALFVIWHLSIQGKTIFALLVASALIAMPIVVGIMTGDTIPTRAYLAFAGMYIFAGLIWKWWQDGVAPERWSIGEVALALVAAGMFSLANMAFDV